MVDLAQNTNLLTNKPRVHSTPGEGGGGGGAKQDEERRRGEEGGEEKRRKIGKVNGGGGFFLVCEDFGRMFDHSFPACSLL